MAIAAAVKRKRLPSIFAQRTERNDRICSLLSALLLRRPRPSYYSVISASFPSPIEAQNHLLDHSSAPLVAILVKCNAAKSNRVVFEYLNAVFSKTAITCVELTIDSGTPLSSCHDKINLLFQMIINRGSVTPQVFMIALDESADRLVKFLSTTFDAVGSDDASSVPLVKGVILINPSSFQNMSSLHVEHIVLQLGKGSFDVPQGRDLALVNSKGIVVDFFETSNVTCWDQHTMLLVARLLLKYIDAVLRTECNSTNGLEHTSNKGIRKPNITEPKHMARL